MLNKELLNNLEVTITEGHSVAIGKLRKDLYEYKVLCDKIYSVQKQIEGVIGADYIEIFKQYARAQDNKAHFEQRVMYIQGMRDYHGILHFLDDGALDKWVLDYDLKCENTDD